MRRRLYFVLPTLQTAQRTMDDLLLARIEERHIHFLADRNAPMDGLHEANVLQKSDVVHGAELGMVIGGVGGLLLGAFIVLAPPGGFELQLVTVLLTALGGAFFGAWASTLTAARLPNSRLIAFSKDIEEGRYLMMVDVPGRRVDEIRALVEQRHPEASPGGMDPAMPAFP